MSDETQVDPIKVAFTTNLEAGKTEDEIKISMVMAGAPFNTVTKLYNAFLVDAGIVDSKDTKVEKLDELMEGRSVETEDELNAAVAAFIASVKGVDEKSAGGSIRWWCRKHDKAYFIKPKAESTGRMGFAKRYYAALIENPMMTREEADFIINGEGDNPETSANIKRKARVFHNIRRLANTIASKYIDGFEVEADDAEEEDGED